MVMMMLPFYLTASVVTPCERRAVAVRRSTARAATPEAPDADTRQSDRHATTCPSTTSLPLRVSGPSR